MCRPQPRKGPDRRTERARPRAPTRDTSDEARGTGRRIDRASSAVKLRTLIYDARDRPEPGDVLVAYRHRGGQPTGTCYLVHGVRRVRRRVDLAPGLERWALLVQRITLPPPGARRRVPLYWRLATMRADSGRRPDPDDEPAVSSVAAAGAVGREPGVPGPAPRLDGDG